MRFAGFLIILMSFMVGGRPAFALVNAEPLRGQPDLVRLEFSDGDSVCTGFFAAPTLIVTAAHCLFREDGTVHVLSRIIGVGDQVLNLKVLEMVPHPKYYRGGWSSNDVAIIRTAENKAYQGDFGHFGIDVSLYGTATFFGAGRTYKPQEKYGRTTGRSSYLRMGSFLYAVGKSKNTSERGVSVSVAPNDSGAPILDPESKRVIALASKATVSMTKDSWFPALSVGTVLSTPLNSEFLKAFGVRFE